MQLPLKPLTGALCLIGMTSLDATADHTIWHSPLDFTTQSPFLTIEPTTQTIRVTTSSPGGLEWIDLGLVLSSDVVIDSVLVCYELADPSSFITQVRLTRTTTPDAAHTFHDDNTGLQDAGAVCYTSVPMFGHVSIDGTMTLSLRLSFADVSHWIDIGGIGIHVSSGTTPVDLLRFEARPRWQHVQIDWETANEYGHAGFNLYRKTLVEPAYTRINDRLITGRSPHRYLDANVRPSTSYLYRLGEVDTDWRETTYGPLAVHTLDWGSGGTAMSAVTPNPSSGSATLSFVLQSAADVELAIYDASGRLVTRLRQGTMEPGQHSESWDGRDQGGKRVAPGVYFARLTTDGHAFESKLVIAR